MGGVQNTYIDSFFVQNMTDREVTLGDLVNLNVPPNKKVDLLKVPRINKEKINQSQHLAIAINAGILTVIKPRQTNLPKQVQQAILADLEDIGTSGDTTKSVVITAPTNTEELPLWLTGEAIVIVEIRGVTDTGTVTFSLEYRDFSTAYTSGIVIPSTSIVADTDSQSQGGFNSANIPKNNWVTLVTSAKTGNPTQLSVNIKYKIF